MSTVATISLEPRAISAIVSQVRQWPRRDRMRLLRELRESIQSEAAVEDEEDWKSADPEDLLAAIWAELPESGSDITDAEIEALKTKRRLEKLK